MRRGDDKTLSKIARDIDNDNAIIALNTCSLAFTVKEREADTDAQAKIRKDSDIITEINITNTDGGAFEVYIDSADTSALSASEYLYDIRLKDANDKIKTLETGTITLRAEITRSL